MLCPSPRQLRLHLLFNYVFLDVVVAQKSGAGWPRLLPPPPCVFVGEGPAF